MRSSLCLFSEGAWRSKKARRKVEAMKLERQRLREEACAIKLQSAWRIRKARAKVERLKAEKQRLLEEGAALMFQVLLLVCELLKLAERLENSQGSPKSQWSSSGKRRRDETSTSLENSNVEKKILEN